MDPVGKEHTKTDPFPSANRMNPNESRMRERTGNRYWHRNGYGDGNRDGIGNGNGDRDKDKDKDRNGNGNGNENENSIRKAYGNSDRIRDSYGDSDRIRRKSAILALAFILIHAILTSFSAVAQRRVGIACYDVDKLYDTIPALFYNDEDYTPSGRYGWTTERYRRKIRHTAAVIDSMELPIVALWGVENEAVVRDLAAACRGDYAYLHRTLNALDGMDFALLYYGDAFCPERVEEGRRYLYVEGTLGRDTVGLVLCAEDRMAAWVVHDLREERPGVRLLVLGRSEGLDPAAYGLRDVHAAAARAGRGTVRSRGRWRMRERILVDTAFRVCGGDVFMRGYLLDPKSGNPLPTYSAGRYRGGYSRSLPVYGYFE